jgi:hypothetical protein
MEKKSLLIIQKTVLEAVNNINSPDVSQGDKVEALLNLSLLLDERFYNRAIEILMRHQNEEIRNTLRR